MNKYVFFEKDQDLEMEEFGLLFWLKFVYQKKVFSTDELIPVTSTPAVKLRLILRRLMSKGYIFRATKSEGIHFENDGKKRTCLGRLKFYSWADTRTIYENTELIRMAR